LLYDSLGIRIDFTMTKIKFYNTFMTLFFDWVQVLISVALVFIYRSQRKDSIKPVSNDEGTCFLLHPVFEKQQESLCIFAIILLAISTIFIQTII
jgi:hypothetical protein